MKSQNEYTKKLNSFLLVALIVFVMISDPILSSQVNYETSNTMLNSMTQSKIAIEDNTDIIDTYLEYSVISDIVDLLRN